ncbi:hypothetical protein GCM10009092_30120 [Bowmanella denitrificans]|uniref:Uncharacterized protein n=1 Tax=Bowmanella denitrificans TaxID=366582 RepID=A0ABP3H7R9_9ALTE
MKLRHGLFSLLLVGPMAWAQPQISELEYGMLYSSGFSPIFPQLIVVNRLGQVIHYHTERDPALKLSLVKNQPVDEQEKMQAALPKLLPSVTDFSQTDYTFILITLHEKVDNCQLCEAHKTINQKVIASLGDKTAQEYQIKVYFPEIPSHLSKEEILERYPYVQFR